MGVSKVRGLCWFRLLAVPSAGFDVYEAFVKKLSGCRFSVLYDLKKSAVFVGVADPAFFQSVAAGVPGLFFEACALEPVGGLSEGFRLCCFPVDREVYSRVLRRKLEPACALDFGGGSVLRDLFFSFRGKSVMLLMDFVPVNAEEVDLEKKFWEKKHPVSRMVRRPWYGLGFLFNALKASQEVLTCDVRLLSIYDGLLGGQGGSFRVSVSGFGHGSDVEHLEAFLKSKFFSEPFERRGVVLSARLGSTLLHFSNDFARVNWVVPVAPLASDALVSGVPLGRELLHGVSLGREVSLPLASLNQHVLVSGLQGVGKTSLALGVAQAVLDSGKKLVVVSSTREWGVLAQKNRGLLVVRFGLVPFNLVRVPEGVDASVYFQDLAGLLAVSMKVGPYEQTLKAVMVRAFRSLYASNRAPSLLELVDSVEAEVRADFGKVGKYEANLRSSLIVLREMVAMNYSVPGGLKVEDCVERGVVFDLSGVGDLVRPVLSTLLLAQVYACVLARFPEGSGRDLELLLVQEEAQKVFERAEFGSWGHEVASRDLAGRLGDFRKHGVGLMLLTHFGDRLDQNLTRHVQNHFVFKQDSQAAEHAVKSLALDKSNDRSLIAASKAKFATLGVGECACLVVGSDRSSVGPFFLKTNAPVDLVPFSDQEVRWRANEVLRGYPRSEKRFDYGLSLDEKKLLLRVVDRPLLSVSERLSELGWNPGFLLGVRRELSRRGVVRAESFVVGKTRKRFVVLSEKGLVQLGKELPDLDLSFWKGSGEGFQHRFWKQIVADKLKKEGFEVAFEVPVDGGFVDVVGTKDGKRVAVEVEVSGSQAEENVQKCVEAGFDEVRVLCASQSVKNRVDAFILSKGFVDVEVGLL